MNHLKLDRPLVVFDLETTGTDPNSDRIVEISLLRVEPDGRRETRTRRVNPERPIPPEASAVHGIHDDDVRDEPPFRQLARGLLDFLDRPAPADLAGFNIQRFDVPLLARELRDCSLDLRVAERRVIDAMTIFHRMERRDLTAAVRFYLDREHGGAHTAEADVLATAEVLDAQVARYAELPDSAAALAEWLNPAVPGGVDREGKLVWRGGEVVLTFGKHRGKPLSLLTREEPGYLSWIAGSDFPEDVKEIVRKALRGEYPEPPADAGSAQST